MRSLRSSHRNIRFGHRAVSAAGSRLSFLLGRYWLVVALLTAICLSALAAPPLNGPVPGPTAPAASADIARELAPAGRCAADGDPAGPAPAQQSAMRCLINYARHTHGLSALTASPLLARASAHKNTLMLRCDDFNHDACGLPWDRVFLQARYLNPSHGENIGWASGAVASPRRVMTLWLGSPEHRANILRPRWTQQAASVRVGVAFQGHADANVWTSDFGGRGLAKAAEYPARMLP